MGRNVSRGMIVFDGVLARMREFLRVICPAISSQRKVRSQKNNGETNQECETKLSPFYERWHGGIIGPG